MAVDIIVLMIGFAILIILALLGAKIPLLCIIGIGFGMIFMAATTGAIINNQLTMLGTPIPGSSSLELLPIIGVVINIVILVDKLR